MAFQKYVGLPDPSGRVDDQTAAALSAQTLRPQSRADSGTIVEIDKSKQLLYFVINGSVEWVLNASTGNGESYVEADQNTPGEVIEGVSLTPSGLHSVNRERPEGWWKGDLGEIYRPKYFVGGVAVHGSDSPEAAERELGLFFAKGEVLDFTRAIDAWVYDCSGGKPE